VRNLSKSKLLAFRQCPKRLSLEIYKPELGEKPASTEASFRAGHSVGEIARRLYDPKNKGVLIDAQAEGYDAALKRSTALLDSTRPVFEAGFSTDGAIAFADVMLPVRKSDGRHWRMVEVKSSTSVKDYHQEDVAIRANNWVYPGGDQYDGRLRHGSYLADFRGQEGLQAVTYAQAS